MQFYQHPNCNSRLKIKRQHGPVATCEEIDKEKVFNIHGMQVFPVVIVAFENLKLIS
jgi:hypothetical protein